jgi:hypothetical protein
VPNLSLGSSAMTQNRQRLTCPRQPAFTSGHQARYPTGYLRQSAEEPTTLPQFPVSFRLSAFASWTSCSRPGVQLPLRSAYRRRPSATDPDGVSTFRTHEMRPGSGALCTPRSAVLTRPVVGPWSPPAAPPRRRPCTPELLPSIRGLWVTRHHRGFTVVHPPGLPLLRSPDGSGCGSHDP